MKGYVLKQDCSECEQTGVYSPRDFLLILTGAECGWYSYTCIHCGALTHHQADAWNIGTIRRANVREIGISPEAQDLDRWGVSRITEDEISDLVIDLHFADVMALFEKEGNEASQG